LTVSDYVFIHRSSVSASSPFTLLKTTVHCTVSTEQHSTRRQNEKQFELLEERISYFSLALLFP
jgi:hypothetical protein